MLYSIRLYALNCFTSKHRIYTITLMKQNKTTDDLLDNAKSVNTFK